MSATPTDADDSERRTDAEKLVGLRQGDTIVVDGERHEVMGTGHVGKTTDTDPTAMVIPDRERTLDDDPWDEVKHLRPWQEEWPPERVGAVVERTDAATVYDIETADRTVDC